MENMTQPPTPAEAEASIAEAEAGQRMLADRVRLPRWFLTSIGSAVALQIATTAVGIAGQGHASGWLVLAAGIGVGGAVAALQLARFRRLNGVSLGGLRSKVVGGSTMPASLSYVAAVGAATWAAFSDLWWLVGICAIVGGLAYSLSGARWLRTFRADPATHGRGESAAWLAVVVCLALVLLALLLVNS